MSRVRALLRLAVMSVAAIAVSSVPVVRAFAQAAAIPSAAAAFVPARDGGSSAHLAHRMPRLRRPKQSLLAVLPESGPVLPSVSSVRRQVPARERSVRAASFASLLDHPPA
ncbi:MAG: hypothetical protein ACHQ2Z_06530 [Elusimicrobiota bacterium]